MTVSTTAISVAYVGNGATTVFPLTFPAQSAADIEVTVGGILVTSFTVSGLPGVGSVTMNIAPANGAAVVITRQVALTQTTSLSNQGGFFPDVVEAGFDKLTMIAQQQEAQIQGLNTPTNPSGFDFTLLTGAQLTVLANELKTYLITAGILAGVEML